MLECGSEDAGGAAYGGVDELVRVVDFEVERRCGVRDCVDAFDGFVERAILRYKEE